MSRKSRSDVFVQLWLRFGEKRPSENEIDQFQMAINALCEHWGYEIYAGNLRVKDPKEGDDGQ